MAISSLILLLLLLTAAAYLIAKRRALQTVGGRRHASQLNSLPSHYGALAAIWCVVPALVLLLLWGVLEGPVIDRQVAAQLDPATLDGGNVNLLLNQAQNLVASGRIDSETDPLRRGLAEHYRALQDRSGLLRSVLAIALAVIGTAFACSRITRTLRARTRVERFMLGVLAAIRADQVGASGSFGAIPLFVGTLLISAIALTVAVPIGLMSAIYLSEYAHASVRSVAKPVMEVLAGIPTVVYGFFAVLTVAPAIRRLGESIGLSVASESALAAGLVMGIMIIPFVSSLSDDVIKAVPQALRDGSFGLGATKSETIRQVVFPAALPGIVGSILLAASRAIGETMIVVMAAGLSANLTFALGLMLFFTTLLLNVFALHVVRKYREQYE